MSEHLCTEVRERLPAYVAGQLDRGATARVHEHLAGCAQCRAEHELAVLLLGARPAVPEGLVERIQTSLRYERATVRRPWWGLAAAAVAALALGIGAASSGRDRAVEPAAYAVEDTVDPWLSDEGVVAGAPVLSDLSEAALQSLLEEMGT